MAEAPGYSTALASARHTDEIHTPEAIKQRLVAPPKQRYLRDLIYGAVDGTVTTFAVVAGVAGARLSATVVIILGVANLIADGFSMAASNFLATRAERQERDQARSQEEHEIRVMPEGEREEIRQIFAMKGFSGDELDRVVEVITADPAVWVDTMMIEELGYSRGHVDPRRAAAATFSAFVVVGSVPLVPFLMELAWRSLVEAPFLWSAGLTGIAFFVVGAMKSRFVSQPWWLSGAETLSVGGAAAAIAFALGAFLERLV